MRLWSGTLSALSQVRSSHRTVVPGPGQALCGQTRMEVEGALIPSWSPPALCGRPERDHLARELGGWHAAGSTQLSWHADGPQTPGDVQSETPRPTSYTGQDSEPSPTQRDVPSVAQHLGSGVIQNEERKRYAKCCQGPLWSYSQQASPEPRGQLSCHVHGGIGQLWPPAPLPLLSLAQRGDLSVLRCPGPQKALLPVRKQPCLAQDSLSPGRRPLPGTGVSKLPGLFSVLSLAPGPAVSRWNSERSRNLDKGQASGVQGFQPQEAQVEGY
ncbi:uncharacterized protein LOC114702645 [Peromyscus leucopus]|uniref:uncharacterized protein LOC114702645 n=1 Tax=Peromyscus leucopus TaxID=10041 RepID=UPI0010A0CCB2|nr:uncharacterized protein LOC114702645 [Peromyscus leucopus]